MGTELARRHIEPEPQLPNAVSVLFYRVVREKTGEVVQFLLARRKKMPEVGRLSPPGGKSESGETPEETAIIEIWEETRLRISRLDLNNIYYGVQNFTISRYTFSNTGFLVRWEKRMGEPENKEAEAHEDWEWVSEHDLDITETEQLSLIATTLLRASKKTTGTSVLQEDITVNRAMVEI